MISSGIGLISHPVMWMALARPGLTLKRTAARRRAGPSRRGRSAPAWAEAAPRLDPVRLVLLDETWATTSPLRRGRQGAGGGADAGGAAHRDAARLRPHPGGGRAGRRA